MVSIPESGLDGRCDLVGRWQVVVGKTGKCVLLSLDSSGSQRVKNVTLFVLNIESQKSSLAEKEVPTFFSLGDLAKPLSSL